MTAEILPPGSDHLEVRGKGIVPVVPNWKTSSRDFDGWWKAPDEFYGGDEHRHSQDYWFSTNHRVCYWSIERMKGGLFAVQIGPLRWRVRPGGPIDDQATARALAWHRKMVRSRLDREFQTFLGSLTLAEA